MADATFEGVLSADPLFCLYLQIRWWMIVHRIIVVLSVIGGEYRSFYHEN